MSQQGIALLHGHEIPPVGFGTWPLVGEGARALVADALDAGYRLIDTSRKYDNEEPVGAAVRESGIPREQIFVTSKFNKEDHSVDGAQRAYDESLVRTGLDYLDLFLIHWPNPWLDRYVDAWRGLVKLVEQGRVKSIGVSNFKPAHVRRIVAATGYVPDVNQIQMSPDLARTETRAFHRELGILTESWSPIGRGGPILDEPVVTGIAERVQRSAAQVILRWHVQQGVVPVPRSTNTQQLRQNVGLFDFELGPADMAQLATLDRGEGAARDSDSPQNGH